ncbi:rRNA maturation RNase YbeY [Fusobacterium perfoetens]|uniref:rRNA maturation RNase YbeY n=1 Tax=Fusobacterium perfoetens TaxID=852 RepID=UPI0004885D97|nr:rRNA maturation RNase YbeY [Fusobacterium perfoetens]MCI6151538.1 rRNA maturation RNase YbeY [Fusobacterium perfoetens]MDY3237196.1 rRNA maturation RNase YbeY [Fusobacterium perfoetens]
MKINLDLGMDIEGFENEIVYEDVEKYVIDVLNKEYESDKEVYVSILLTGNEEIQRVNRDFRGKDMPTDVISFAYHDNEEADNGLYDSLGDIIISLERVEEQRKDYGHSFKREFYYVLTHGLLHLMGYDHIEEEDKKIMRAKEEEILEGYGYTREIK